MKQSSGLGDYYGCLGKPNVHIGARASESQLKKGRIARSPRPAVGHGGRARPTDRPTPGGSNRSGAGSQVDYEREAALAGVQKMIADLEGGGDPNSIILAVKAAFDVTRAKPVFRAYDA